MAEQATSITLQEKRRQLRAFRKQKGLTLAKIGERVGLSKSLLHHFEKGTRNLSEENWNKLQILIFEDEGYGLERRFDSTELDDVAREVKIISCLQKNVDGSKYPKTKIWLAAEMEAAVAKQRAMELAELAHEEHAKQDPGVIKLLPVTEGKVPVFPVSPLEERPAPLQRISIPQDEDLQVRLVYTCQEEQELKREGWKEVPSE